jgi:urea transport system substrate-binding protein
LPALQWGIQNFGPRVFLVGSDYVFPRTANQLIKSRLKRDKGQLAGEIYQPLGTQAFHDTIRSIQRAKPDFIINTLNGDSNQGFFQSLHKAKILAHDLPVISMSVAEDELQHIGLEFTTGHFAAWNYFQSIDSPSNHRFVSAFQKRYGADRVTGDPIETAYTQVHLYALAATKAGNTTPVAVRQAAANLIYAAPQGLIRIDPHNQHTWKVARLGQIQENGQLTIVWSSHTPLKPQPYLS